MDAIQAQEYLRTLRAAEWTNLKGDVRSKESNDVYKRAFPFNNKETVKTTDLVAKLGKTWRTKK